MARRTFVVQQSAKALDQFKQEIASELGITVGADQTSRNNGAVGGHMVRRMVQMAENLMTER